MANFANYGNLETVLTGYAQKINGITEGHTIEGDGTAVTDRDTLNFKDMSVSDDSTTEKTDVKPHRLTQAELADIMSPLPSAFDMSGVSSDAYNFSTSEKVIGTWTDGKPLYQKVISCGALPNSVRKDVAHNISNMETYFIKNAFAYKSAASCLINLYDLDYPTYSIKISFTPTYIQILTKEDMSSYTNSYAVVCYTKTTDVAVASGEKIVGQWIDGKAIFEKVVDCGALPNNNVKSVDTGLYKANVTVISVTGTAKYNSQYVSLPYITSTSSWNILTEVNDNSGTSKLYVQISTGENWSAGTSTVTLRYTKV